METNEQYQARINADATAIFQYCSKNAIKNMPYHGTASNGEPYDILKETLKRCRTFISEGHSNNVLLPTRAYWHDVKEAITAMYVPASMLAKPL